MLQKRREKDAYRSAYMLFYTSWSIAIPIVALLLMLSTLIFPAIK